MSVYIEVAARLITSRDPGNLWRRICLPTTVLITVAIVCLTVSLLNVVRTEDRRSVDRGIASFTDKPEEMEKAERGLYTIYGLSYWRGQQYFLNWIEPMPEGGSVLPPGLDRMLNPGESAVSPALAELIEQHPELRAQFPAYTVLAPEGVVTAGELYAWVRPERSDLLFRSDRPIFLVTEFNATSANRSDHGESITGRLDMTRINMFAAMVVLVPALLLLGIGISASSTVRSERIDLLEQLGASRSWMMRLNVVEVLMYAGPILAIFVPVYKMWAQRQSSIPFVDRQVFRGDFMLTWWQVVAIIAITIGIMILASVVEVWLRSLRKGRVGNLIGRVVMSLRILLVLGAVYLAFAAPPGTNRALMTALSSALMMVAILPGIVKDAAGPLGRLVSRARTVVLQIAGARLHHRSAANMRPFVGLSLVLVVVFLGLAHVAYLREYLVYVDTSQRPSSAVISLPLPYEEGVQLVRQRLPETLAFPFYTLPGTSEDRYQPQHRLGVACEDVARFYRRDVSICEGHDVTVDAFGYAFAIPGASFDPTLSEGGSRLVDGLEPELVIIANESMNEIDEMVRTALPASEFPAVSVSTPEHTVLRDPPSAPWVLRGINACVLLVAVGMIAALVDQSLSQRGFGRELVAIGASPRRIVSIEAVSFALTAGVAVVIGSVFGVVQLIIYKGLVDVPISDIPFGAVYAVLFGILGAAMALIMFVNSRIAFDEMGGNG